MYLYECDRESLRTEIMVTGEIAQWLRRLGAQPEDLNLVLNFHIT